MEHITEDRLYAVVIKHNFMEGIDGVVFLPFLFCEAEHAAALFEKTYNLITETLGEFGQRSMTVVIANCKSVRFSKCAGEIELTECSQPLFACCFVMNGDPKILSLDITVDESKRKFYRKNYDLRGGGVDKLIFHMFRIYGDAHHEDIDLYLRKMKEKTLECFFNII